MTNPYWTRFASHADTLKVEVDRALAHFEVLPVGHGYIDIIVVPSKAEAFLARMTQLGIAATLVTLWCEASAINQERYGCSHGMGGPVRYGTWFSEMCEHDPFTVSAIGIDVDSSQQDPFALADECNAACLGYVTQGMQQRTNYSPCLAPGFWLAVPDAWRSDRITIS